MRQRPYLDWLRILVVLLLIPFHTAWIFSPYAWFLQNGRITSLAQAIIFLQNRYHMELLFLIAGAAAFVSLGSRSPRQYLVERIKRLGLPTLTGMLFLVPPCYWAADRAGGATISLGSYYLSFWQNCFQPFGGTDGAGVTWFLWVLLLCTFVMSPLFIYLRKLPRPGLFERLAGPFARPVAMFALFVPVAAAQIILSGALSTFTIFTNFLYLYYIIFFIYGFFLFSAPGFEKGLIRCGPAAIFVAVTSVTLLMLLSFPDPSHAVMGVGFFSRIGSARFSTGYLLFQGLAALSSWSLLLAILYLARRFLNFANRFLRYGNDIILPFYLVHCTILVLIGRWVIAQPWALPAKFTAIAVPGLILSLGVCEMVRRSNFLRFIFGLRIARTEPIQFRDGVKTKNRRPLAAKPL